VLALDSSCRIHLAAHRVPACAQIMHTFYKGAVEDIPCTGPAPVLIRTDLLRRVLPAWEEITKGIEVHSPIGTAS
jgi:hypothetical protein